MPVTLLTGLLMAVGLVGIVVPVLPGLILVWLSTGLWALLYPDNRAWYVFAVAAVIYAAGVTTQYLIPGRRMRSAGVSTWTLVLAVILGIVGFFVIPVVGALVGFVLGVFLVELARTRAGGPAWGATKHAVVAVAQSMGIELVTGLLIAVVWVVGVFALGAG